MSLSRGTPTSSSLSSQCSSILGFGTGGAVADSSLSIPFRILFGGGFSGSTVPKVRRGVSVIPSTLQDKQDSATTSSREQKKTSSSSSSNTIPVTTAKGSSGVIATNKPSTARSTFGNRHPWLSGSINTSTRSSSSISTGSTFTNISYGGDCTPISIATKSISASEATSVLLDYSFSSQLTTTITTPSTSDKNSERAISINSHRSTSTSTLDAHLPLPTTFLNMSANNDDKVDNGSTANVDTTIVAVHTEADNENDVRVDDIEELHRKAIIENNCSKIYIDPTTGFQVFTEIAHLQRGVCCGNKCRHCPYGWKNVSANERRSRTPKVESGNKAQISNLLKSYEQQALSYQQQQQRKQQASAAALAVTYSSSVAGTMEYGRRPQNDNVASDQVSMNSSIGMTTGAGRNGIKSKTGGRHGGKYTDKNVPYTRTGDTGTAQLFTGERRRKDDTIFEAMGDVDELCSITGVVYAELCKVPCQGLSVTQGIESVNQKTNEQSKTELQEWLLDIMSRLFDIGALLAKPRRRRQHEDDEDEEEDVSSSPSDGFAYEHIESLEEWIDIMTDSLPELKNFILPTGNTISAQLHVARTVCRRAERRVIACNFSSLRTSIDTTDPISTKTTLTESQQVDPNIVKYLNRLSDFYFTSARYYNFIQGDEEIVYRRPIAKDSKQRQRVPFSFTP